MIGPQLCTSYSLQVLRGQSCHPPLLMGYMLKYKIKGYAAI